MLSDRIKELRAALEASPSKIVLIVTRDHQDNEPGSKHADKKSLPSGERGWAHVAIAFLDKDGNPVFAEKTPSKPGLGGLINSPNKSGTEGRLVTEYTTVEIIPIDLTRFGPGARERFITALVEALIRPYSFFGEGDHCSSSFGKALKAAMDQSTAPRWLKTTLELIFLPFGGRRAVNLYSPNDAYLAGKKVAVPFRFDPDSPTQGNTVKHDWKYMNLDKVGAQTASISNSVNDGHNAALAGLALGTIVTLPPEARASEQPRADDDQKPLQQELQDASDDEDDDDDDDDDALTDVSLQDPENDEDDDEENLEEELRLASDSQDPRPGDAPQQPDIDDDADDDDEDTPTDDRAQQPVVDDDDEEQADDEEEELEDASDAQDASTADALLETAKAEPGADATADGQAGPQLATSAPITADDGFSFSLFPKPVPTEVAKEALPAEQASPVEESPGSGLPGSESADPGLDSANVGNAAPGHERVVHHGDLAP